MSDVIPVDALPLKPGKLPQEEGSFLPARQQDDAMAAYRKALTSKPWLSRIVIIYDNGKHTKEWDPATARCQTRPQKGMWWFGDAKDGQMIGKWDPNIGLGEVEVVPVVDQPHALWLRKGGVYAESFKWGSATFKRIAAAKKSKDDRPMWGGNSLVFIPEVGQFATYFAHTTNRAATQELMDEAGRRCTAIVTKESNNRNSWMVCKVLGHSDENSGTAGLWSRADAEEAHRKFVNTNETLPEGWAGAAVSGAAAAPEGVVR